MSLRIFYYDVWPLPKRKAAPDSLSMRQGFLSLDMEIPSRASKGGQTESNELAPPLKKNWRPKTSSMNRYA